MIPGKRFIFPTVYCLNSFSKHFTSIGIRRYILHSIGRHKAESPNRAVPYDSIETKRR